MILLLAIAQHQEVRAYGFAHQSQLQQQQQQQQQQHVRQPSHFTHEAGPGGGVEPAAAPGIGVGVSGHFSNPPSHRRRGYQEQQPRGWKAMYSSNSDSASSEAASNAETLEAVTFGSEEVLLQEATVLSHSQRHYNHHHLTGVSGSASGLRLPRKVDARSRIVSGIYPKQERPQDGLSVEPRAFQVDHLPSTPQLNAIMDRAMGKVKSMVNELEQEKGRFNANNKSVHLWLLLVLLFKYLSTYIDSMFPIRIC